MVVILFSNKFWTYLSLIRTSVTRFIITGLIILLDFRRNGTQIQGSTTFPENQSIKSIKYIHLKPYQDTIVEIILSIYYFNFAVYCKFGLRK